MTKPIAAQTVALSLMREALTMLDGADAAEAADLLKRAIAAVPRPHHAGSNRPRNSPSAK